MPAASSASPQPGRSRKQSLMNRRAVSDRNRHRLMRESRSPGGRPPRRTRRNQPAAGNGGRRCRRQPAAGNGGRSSRRQQVARRGGGDCWSGHVPRAAAKSGPPGELVLPEVVTGRSREGHVKANRPTRTFSRSNPGRCRVFLLIQSMKAGS